jgi:pimeloyl-ACP methyl ester carboxylesterase
MQSAGSVRSRDGTTVGYRQFGQGPALILLHGGMMASQNFVRLAVTLSDAFSVFVPDRRGRGMSGPYGDHYSLASDCEDVRALIDQTGASNVFGLSSGAIIALRSALEIPAIRKVAAYEPPVAVEGFHPAHWAERFDREVQRGDLAGALITVLKGTGDSRLLRLVPNALLAPVLRLGVRFDAKQNKPGDVSIADLIPTMHYDAQIVTEASAALEELRAMHSDVLLMGGSKSAAFLQRGLEVLAKLLPRAARLELRGLGHTAADNEGKPERVAEALRRFFEN